ncbi:hypothetical protein M378DRAFT_12576 [Amanita muscaria Koide BX008]|uniref:Uncharacterized protein n=1 Tax=Amanita muscaria (strain Koide BX008) TaxID=946122 RepID=A0A0C2X241_AMAMK|nr:hypothetical protein M378DRAFT_12576 [Amanita muscaria Koide BX008]
MFGIGETPGDHPLFEKFKQLLERYKIKLEDEKILLVVAGIVEEDFATFKDAIEHQNIGIDDRKMLLEKVLTLMAKLDGNPRTRPFSQVLQDLVIGILYEDLPHPSGGFLPYKDQTDPAPSTPNQNRGYIYRSADGSGYNPLLPSLGKAGHPYAKSVPSTQCNSAWGLPNPSLVFDALLKRDKFENHPGGISSLFFAFADVIIHDIFYSTGTNQAVNNTSSYLDLSILYGTSEKVQASVRRQDGTGKLYNDTFADARLVHMPPAACALLVLLSRNHNYIAEKLLNINESNKFKSPPPKDLKECKDQDDEIFERARLVNCGFFVHIILGDYVGAILGLVRDGNSWRLDPLKHIRSLSHDIVPRGEGNVVSIEFNLLYTWHATLSTQNTDWLIEHFTKVLGVDPRELTPENFRNAASKLRPKGAPREWEFAGLKRTPSGSFKDEDLAKILHDAIEWRAGAYGARNIPDALRVIEILNIEKARKWGACTLNEFRKFLKLKPLDNFDEWNRNKEVAAAAATLYKHIDNLELYVGLQAEESKEPGPGAGLCPGYTISRAILADAVCLTRGDRFFTVDYTPANLTSWGYQDCQYDTKDGSFGGLLTKLLYRTLPDYFPSDSAYAHFPFLDPSWMKKQMIENGRSDVNQYSWSRPQSVRPSISVSNDEEVRRVLHDSVFASDAKDRLYEVFGNSSTDVITWRLRFEELIEGKGNSEKSIFNGRPGEYFADKTRELIKNASYQVGQKKQVDIVKDILNELPVRWFSDTSNVNLPKDANFADVGRYVYLNDDSGNDWHFLSTAREFVDRVKELNGVGEELAVHTVAAAIPTAPFFSKALVHIVDYYLSDNKLRERAEIVKLAKEGNSSSIMTYVREALRQYPVISGFYRTALRDTSSLGIRVERAQRVYVGITENSDLAISDTSPVVIGFENTGFFTLPFFEEAVSAILLAIFELAQVQRATGVYGDPHRFTEYFLEVPKTQYIDSRGQVTPWPESMVLEYL